MRLGGLGHLHFARGVAHLGDGQGEGIAERLLKGGGSQVVADHFRDLVGAVGGVVLVGGHAQRFAKVGKAAKAAGRRFLRQGSKLWKGVTG